MSRGLASLAAIGAAGALLGAMSPGASAEDEHPCGKAVPFPQYGLELQPCPIGHSLPEGIPVYAEPVPSSPGGPIPAPQGWLRSTEGKYFECDRIYPNAVYSHPTQGWRNIWWARTISDEGIWGWVPEVFFRGGDTYEPDFGLRSCPPPPAPAGPCDGVSADSGAKVRARLRGGRRMATTRYAARPQVRGVLKTTTGEPIGATELCVVETNSRGPAGRTVAGSVMTNDRGEFKYRVPQGPSRRVAFLYRSGSIAASGAVKVRVRAPVSLRAKPHSLRTGETVRFRGRLRGGTGVARRLVEMQVRRDGRWESLLGTTRTRKKGGFGDRYRFRFSEGVQHYAFRAHVPPQRGLPFAAGSSRPVRVQVKG